MQALLRRLLLVALCTLAVAAPMRAQEGEDDYDFSEIPVEEEEIPYIGVGGGYQIVMSLMNFDELNASVASPLGMPDITGQLFMHGGGGWTAIGIVPNVRVGVFGGGGSKEESIDTTIGSSRYTRALRFSSGYTAAHIDYAFTPFSKFTVAPGVMLGGASTVIEYAQTANDATFPSMFDPADLRGIGTSNNRQRAIERNYFFVQPVLNLEYALTQFILVRIGGGFMFPTGDPKVWQDRQGSEITEVPEEITTRGVTIQGGLFIGLFQQ